ncbi:MAG: EpsG family protein, partial [Flavobacterium sp.]|nr:EpsG family protein [Flavobacterium sp.]
AHIFFYGVFPYVADRNRKKLWFAVLAIFVHFSFLLPLLVLIAYMLVGNRARILFYLFIATSLVSEVNLEVVRNSLNSVLPSFFKEKVDTYTNEVYVEHRAIKNANPSLHFVLYKKALVYGVFIFLVFIYYMGLDYARKYKYLFNLFCFSLLFLSVTNISSLVPSGGRFTTIAILFAMSVIFFYVRSVPLKPPFRILLPVVLMGFVLYIVVAFRAGTDTIGVMTLFGNPIQLLFVESDTAVIELIK